MASTNGALSKRRRSAAEKQRALKRTSQSNRRGSFRTCSSKRVMPIRNSEDCDQRAEREMLSKRCRLSDQGRSNNTSAEKEKHHSDETDNEDTESVSRLDEDLSNRSSPSQQQSPKSSELPSPPVSNRRPPQMAPRTSSSPASFPRSLAERRKYRGGSTSVSPSVFESAHLDNIFSSSNGTPIENNRLKARLAEAIAEKRSMRASLDLANEKCQNQRKEIAKLSQQIKAFEEMVRKPNAKGRRSSKKGTWSKEDENSVIAPYKGIRLQIDLVVNRAASLVVSESSFISGSDVRVHDWTASSTPVDQHIAKNYVLFVKQPDGIVAIPTCAMTRCFSKKFYSERFPRIALFVRHVTKNLIQESMGMGMNDEEKNECLAKMSSYPPLLSKFRTALREETNNCKQGARVTFLKSLGFRKAQYGEEKKNMNENAQRIKEKQMVYEKCFKRISDVKVDTMHWRTAPYGLLYNEDTDDQDLVDRMLAAEEDALSDDRVDILFMNEAARLAFNRLRGYNVPENARQNEKETTIIWLARADAWMTTAMLNIRGTGKGGTHSHGFIESYEALLPEALDNIIKDIWNDLQELSPQELSVSLSGEISNKRYGNDVRQWTIVLKSPDDDYLYLLVTPKYFSRYICSWIGNIMDCQIGRCKSDENRFIRITKDMSFDEVEESDIEEEDVESRMEQTQACTGQTSNNRSEADNVQTANNDLAPSPNGTSNESGNNNQ